MDFIKIKFSFATGLFLFFACIFPGINPVYAQSVIVKAALITPEGSAWTKMMIQMAEEVRQKTDGEVDFRIYPGGVSGDEMDVIRKMQAGRIHAAGFSGVGLGVLSPKIRILEAPLLYENYDQIDQVKKQFFSEFALDLDKTGYVLLGFAEAGFVYIFSKADLSDPNALSKIKMWSWKGDPVAETFLNLLGVKTYPLHLSDVNAGLETGMIDSFYSPPLGAVAFQWHSKIRYMLDYPVVNSTGALVMKKDVFNRISPKNREILKNLAGKYCDQLVQITRKDNHEALAAMKDSGIVFISPTREQILSFKKSAQKSYEQNIPKLYSQDLLNRVHETIATHHGNHPPG
jgi:TRAP-type C4-dicarboxylate transport system substrate-binding protein